VRAAELGRRHYYGTWSHGRRPLVLHRASTHGATWREWVTRVRHTQHAQPRCTDPLCDNSHYGLGRAEQHTGSGDHLRHEEAVVVDVLKP